MVIFQLSLTLGSLTLETAVNSGLRWVTKISRTENTKFNLVQMIYSTLLRWSQASRTVRQLEGIGIGKILPKKCTESMHLTSRFC